MNERVTNINQSSKPVQGKGLTVRQIHRIRSNNPPQYEAIFGALKNLDEASTVEQAKEIPGQVVVSISNQINDSGVTIEGEFSLPESWRNRGPVRTGNRVLYVRGNLEEAFCVEPKSSIPSNSTIEELFPPYTTQEFNPPYLSEWNIIEGEVKPNSSQPATHLPTTQSPQPNPQTIQESTRNPFINALTDQELKNAV